MKLLSTWLSLLVCAAGSSAVLAADPGGGGPLPAVTYSDAGLPSHTIYRPRDLQGSYPVVLWGNGSCVNSNFGYREFLAELASHGFVVLAVGPYRDSPAPRQQRPADPAQWPEFETQPQDLLDALNWIESEVSRADSELAGHVNTERVAVMGHSCGGLQALKVSTDPRVSTTLILNSGMTPEGDQYNARFGLQRSQLAALHAPIGYFIGGESDIAYVNANLDWDDLQQLQIPAVNANLDVGHGATFSQPRGGVFAAAPLAWLQWQLQDDKAAAHMFTGAQCGFCSGTDWVLRRHLIE